MFIDINTLEKETTNCIALIQQYLPFESEFVATDDDQSQAESYHEIQMSEEDKIIQDLLSFYTLRFVDDNFKEANDLYKEMQSVTAYKTMPSSFSYLSSKVFKDQDILQALVGQQTKVFELTKNNEILKNENQNLRNHLLNTQESLETARVGVQQDQLSIVKQEKDLLFKRLVQVQQESEMLKIRLKKEQMETQKKNSNSQQQQKLMGAANLVKEDLPYKVGELIVQSSKSFDGMIGLPKNIMKELKRKDEYQSKSKGKPALESYADIDEAKKIQKHLSYRLGVRIVDAVEHPQSLAILPLSLVKEWVKFRSNRKK